MLPTNDPPASPSTTPRLWFGIAMIFFGVLLALENLAPSGFNFIGLWPIVLIIFGISKVTSRREERGISGGLLILGGVFLLVFNFGRASLVEALWPLFIVAFGVYLVVKTLRKNRGIPSELASHDSFISSTAIFGGSKRRVTQQDFKGGELTAIFGGFELDLRQATLEGNQVRVDVFVLFGGGELRIPQDWAVTMKGSAILGAFEDKTLHMPSSDAPRIHLVVTGLVLFGGLTVMN